MFCRALNSPLTLCHVKIWKINQFSKIFSFKSAKKGKNPPPHPPPPPPLPQLAFMVKLQSIDLSQGKKKNFILQDKGFDSGAIDLYFRNLSKV